MRTDKQPRTRMDPTKRRALIQTAAIHAFAEAAYEDVSLASIATRSNASEALIHKYFGTKSGLYATILENSFNDIKQRQKQALTLEPHNLATRERIKIVLNTYLDYLIQQPQGWAEIIIQPGNEPHAATLVRTAVHNTYIKHITSMIGGIHLQRDRYALHGFFGFLSTACLAWLHSDNPEQHRHSLIDATLGSLEGALGDWRS